jgi:hypothetical protein
MEKVLKPFVVLTTYVVLYALTYSIISAVVSALFWTNYFEVVNSKAMIIILIIGVASHLLYAVIRECEK